MGVSKMKTKVSKAMLDIAVLHSAVKDIPEKADLVITSKALEARVKDTIGKYHKNIGSMQNVVGCPNVVNS